MSLSPLIGHIPKCHLQTPRDPLCPQVPQMLADAAKSYGAGVLTGLELLEFELGKV
jgi:hypothetical protein